MNYPAYILFEWPDGIQMTNDRTPAWAIWLLHDAEGTSECLKSNSEAYFRGQRGKMKRFSINKLNCPIGHVELEKGYRLSRTIMKKEEVFLKML